LLHGMSVYEIPLTQNDLKAWFMILEKSTKHRNNKMVKYDFVTKVYCIKIIELNSTKQQLSSILNNIRQ
jgi:hypothetical protein